VKQLAQHYPIVTLCQVLALPRSSLYYKPVAPKSDDALKAQIAQLAAAHPTYGYRRIESDVASRRTPR
jgi:putative transposase